MYHDPTKEVHGEGRQRPFAAAVYRGRREKEKECKGCGRCGRRREGMEQAVGAGLEEGAENRFKLGTGLRELLFKGVDKRLGRGDLGGVEWDS